MNSLLKHTIGILTILLLWLSLATAFFSAWFWAHDDLEFTWKCGKITLVGLGGFLLGHYILKSWDKTR